MELQMITHFCLIVLLFGLSAYFYYFPFQKGNLWKELSEAVRRYGWKRTITEEWGAKR